MIGNLLGNRYEIMEQLGGGGMAVVYKGRDTILNRLVTIKVLRPEHTSDEDFVKRFRSEAQAVASLSHPNIVSIYDVGRADDVDYLVMEYVEGDDLKTVIKQHAPLTPVRAAQIAMQIGEALEHAHENNIVHRDIKPQNVLITRGGVAKLTDFGIAMGATAATIVKSEEVMGSVHYVSPEQAKGEKTGPRSDIYSLGVVLYEMTTNALPFEGDTPVGVALKHVQEDATLPSRLNPAIPLRLEKVITMAMAKNPSKRFENARQMVQELAGVTGAGAEPLNADVEDEFATRLIPTVGSGYQNNNDYEEVLPASRGKRSYKWLWAVLVLAVVVGSGAALYQYFFNVKEVTMVDLRNFTKDEAERKLDELGFDIINWTTEFDREIPEGQVVRHTPAAEAVVKVTRQVDVVISKGAEKIPVPKLVDYDSLEAVRILARLNLESDVVSEYSDKFEAGVVMEQDPQVNEEVKEGSVVVLTVSKGKEPITNIMPPLVGKTLETAKGELGTLKITVSDDAINKVGSVIYDEGVVTAQYPEAGQQVQENDNVRLTVSTGPGPKVYTASVDIYIGDRRMNHVQVYVTDTKGSGRNALDIVIEEPGHSIQEVKYYGDDEVTIKAYLNDTLYSTSIYKSGRKVE